MNPPELKCNDIRVEFPQVQKWIMGVQQTGTLLNSGETTLESSYLRYDNASADMNCPALKGNQPRVMFQYVQQWYKGFVQHTLTYINSRTKQESCFPMVQQT